MIELIVLGATAIAATGGGIAIRRRLSHFNNQVNEWENNLNAFMKQNNISTFDVEMSSEAEIHSSLEDTLKFVGRGLGKGYDFIVCNLHKGYTFPTHIHDRTSEFFYVISGLIEVQSESGKCQIGPGEYAYVKNKTEHAFRVIDDTTCIVIAFPSLIEES